MSENPTERRSTHTIRFSKTEWTSVRDQADLAAENGGVPGCVLRVCAPDRAAGPVATRWAVAPTPSKRPAKPSAMDLLPVIL